MPMCGFDFPCQCQAPYPEKPWVVTRIELTADAIKYGKGAQCPFFVQGVNRSHPSSPEPFAWRVPNVNATSYDLSGVEVPTIPRGTVYDRIGA